MNPSQSIVLAPIARVSGGRHEPIDDQWDSVQSTIVFDPQQFTADALMGLDAFSHIEVVFHFDRVPDEEIRSGARHPRGEKTGPRSAFLRSGAKDDPTGSACAFAGLRGLRGFRSTFADLTRSTGRRSWTSNPS